jgi:hypothetical protein
MAINAFENTVATPGTPQQVVFTGGPQTIVGGVTYPAGSVPTRGAQILLSAHPGNTAGKNIFVGVKGMSIASKTGILAVLPTPTTTQNLQISLGQFGGMVDVADLYIDTDSVAAATERIIVSVIG